MLKKFKILVVMLLLCMVIMPMPAQAQNEEPVVYGVFFYSPRCGHCHEVLTNHWPQIENEFGDQLKVIFIDVSSPAGSNVMTTATDALNIDSNGVPMLIIGNHVLIGSLQIPEETAAIIRDGLSQGGIGIPDFPGAADLFEMAGIPVLDNGASLANQPTHQTASPVTTSAPTIEANESLMDKLRADPLANTGAILVLFGLLLSFMMIGLVSWQGTQQLRQSFIDENIVRWIVIGLALFAALLSITLMLGEYSEWYITVIAFGELVAFTTIAAVIGKEKHLNALPSWLMPMAILAGLGVAGYLAYVEVSTTEAVCGTVGHCNTVQESKYASIFGVPIGVLGITGYGMIFGLWVWDKVNPNDWADLGLMALISFGVLFSTYLTFLEPFVIGATCVWCLTSAVTMLLLLWMTAPRGYQALQHLTSK